MNIHLHCPHCKNPIELVRLEPGQEVTCTACGSNFRLEDISTTGWTPGGKPIGRFEILEAVGHGGFGTVFKARDPQLDRTVAIKIPRRGNIGDKPQDLDRFLREARSVAQLRHPSIVAVHEVGTLPPSPGTPGEGPGVREGTPYLVSDFIEGITLADLLTARRPTPRESAQLIADVADALDYAHKQGVVHRDVKPSNIMLEAGVRNQGSGVRNQGSGDRDQRADKTGAAGSSTTAVPGLLTPDSCPLTPDPCPLTPRILDFGLAKRDAGEITVTMAGEVLGTPAYMSPEQARGDAHQVDGKSDIYSLGVILYQLLTGELPFRGNKRMLLHQVLHDEPKSPRSLNDHIPRDLETITLKAMAKEAARRYSTACEFAEDLRRWLRGEPIVARPVGRVERLLRWCRRNPVVAALTGAVAATVLIGALVSLLFAHQASQNAEDEKKARRQADIEKEKAKESEASAKASEIVAKANEELAKKRAAETRLEVERHRVANGLRLAEDGQVLSALFEFAAPLQDEGSPSTIEKLHLRRLSNYWLYASAQRVTSFAWAGMHFDPEAGTFRVLRNGGDGSVGVWSLNNKPLSARMQHQGPVLHAAFSPDGRLVVTASLDNTARVWNAASGQPITPPLRHKGSVQYAQFSPDGRRVVTASMDKTAVIWDTRTGEPLLPPMKHDASPIGVTRASFSPDGRWVLTITHDAARIWAAADGKLVSAQLKHPGGPLTVGAFSPDSRKIVTAGNDSVGRIWEASTGRIIAPPLRHDFPVTSASFSPDSLRIVTGSVDKSSLIWDATTGQRTTGPMRHPDGVRDASFSPDGRRVVTLCEDGTIRIWEANTGELVGPVLQYARDLVRARYLSDGRRLITEGKLTGIWDGANQSASPLSFLVQDKLVQRAAFSPDGRCVVTIGFGIARGSRAQGTIWDSVTGTPLNALALHEHKGFVNYAEFSPDGKRLVTASNDEAMIWDTASGKAILPPLRHQGFVRLAAFTSDGSWVLSVSSVSTTTNSPNRSIQHTEFLFWDANGKVAARSPRLSFEPGAFLAFCPKTSKLLIREPTPSHAARIWDAITGQPVTPFLEHAEKLYFGWFSPRGDRAITLCSDGARIWDSATGRLLARMVQRRRSTKFSDASFSPDGGRVLIVNNNEVRLWSAANGEPLTPAMQHKAEVWSAAFSPDGLLVVTTSARTARVWDAASGQPLTPPLEHESDVYFACFSPDGNSVLTLHGKMKVCVWRIGPNAYSAADWVLLTQFLLGSKHDRFGGAQLLSDEERQKAWTTFRAKYPEDLTVTPEQALAWHRREAEACLKEKNAPAFLFHYFRGHVEWPIVTGWPRF